MTTVLRASGSAQFLSIVPALAGFTPRESIALLPFHGIRCDGAMRLDLPDAAIPVLHYAAAAVDLVARVPGTDAVAVVVYTDESPQHTPDGLVLPQAVAVDTLLGCAEEAGLRVIEALCVTAEGWSHYGDAEPELHPLSDITPPPAASALGDVSGDQFSGAELPPVPAGEAQQVERVLRGLDGVLGPKRQRSTRSDEPQVLAACVLLDDIPAFLESVLADPDALPPLATAALVWCLGRPPVRDTAIAQWATDHRHGIRTMEAQLAFAAAGSPVPDDIGRVFLGCGPAPDGDRLRAALRVVRHATARAPRKARPGPLTVAAWLSWALGRATHAGRYLDMAREIDPAYSLALLLDTMISGAVLPEWAFRGRRE
ncbi:DUF4192 domain-containing protein [Zhihengliuella sp. ISTPL4]|uniref:DUF4192 domain-containing protein n=1 Tax=Zhihengliuella sp. ISTPL4 TaxID=2058657 RepID=UPI000C7BD5D7|nr:DUF4192 domain-containing protein [Zhihengliuella sp. ISTPL4]